MRFIVHVYVKKMNEVVIPSFPPDSGPCMSGERREVDEDYCFEKKKKRSEAELFYIFTIYLNISMWISF